MGLAPMGLGVLHPRGPAPPQTSLLALFWKLQAPQSQSLGRGALQPSGPAPPHTVLEDWFLNPHAGQSQPFAALPPVLQALKGSAAAPACANAPCTRSCSCDGLGALQPMFPPTPPQTRLLFLLTKPQFPQLHSRGSLQPRVPFAPPQTTLEALLLKPQTHFQFPCSFAPCFAPASFCWPMPPVRPILAKAMKGFANPIMGSKLIRSFS
mmetsp:Transcript_23531/g.44392  ORF Transcript_23531/g.44392 Transcript_23531/m.44392 type:complete len:209 (+) Transcript_23531:70-696(+)